jgi:hypothetical protein
VKALTTHDYRSLIDQEMQNLGLVAQRKVLEFAKSLRGETADADNSPSSIATRFAGVISKDELLVMQNAIEASCEQIDADSW